MNLNVYFNNLRSNWAKAINRFPIFIFASSLLCVFLSYVTHYNVPDIENILMASLIGLAGIFATYLYNERFEILGIKKWFGFILSLMLAVLVYYVLPSKNNWHIQWPSYVVVTSLAIFHFLYACIPFINKKDNSNFLRYNVYVLEIFFESFLLCLILYGLLALALYSLKLLFGLSNSGEFATNLLIWIAGFVHTINFLSNYPSLSNNCQEIKKFKSRFFKILVLNIGIPVIALYGTIIIAYILKMLLNKNYEPWITEMCSWYIVIGLIIYSFSRLYDLDNESKLANVFNKYMPIFSLPIIGLLVYSIVKNYTDTGFTSSTYYLILLALGSIVIFSTLIFNKNVNLLLFPYTLITCALFSILSGPYNVWTYPLSNQKVALIKTFEQSKIIENGAFNFTNKLNAGEARKVEKNLYFIDGQMQLNYLKAYDKKKEFKDSITLSELITKLNLSSTLGTNYNNDNKYYEIIPVIDVKSSEKVYTVLNKYVNLPKEFTGIKVGFSGKIIVYQKGNQVDSLQIKHRDISQQKMQLISIAKKDSFDFYIGSMSYISKAENCEVVDFTGVVIGK